METLKSTLAELTAAKLYKYMKDNAPVPPSVTSVQIDPTNPGAYIKWVNLRQGIREVYGGEDADPIYGSNQKAIDQAGHDFTEWENHGKRDGAPPPAFPSGMKKVDLVEFDRWWTYKQGFYDVNSPFFHDEDYSTMLDKHQFFKVSADPWYPAVVIVPETVTVLPSTGNPIGKQISAYPPLFLQATTGHNIGDTYKNATGSYVLINMSPMLNDPAKFDWMKI